jgi:hypothetical protein
VAGVAGQKCVDLAVEAGDLGVEVSSVVLALRDHPVAVEAAGAE